MPDMTLTKLGSGLLLVLIVFLVSSYFGSFVTKEAYSKDMTALEVLKNDMKYVRGDLKEIKEMLR